MTGQQIADVVELELARLSDAALAGVADVLLNNIAQELAPKLVLEHHPAGAALGLAASIAGLAVTSLAERGAGLDHDAAGPALDSIRDALHAARNQNGVQK